MAKKKNYYICISCGTDYSKWQGRCLQCKEWNTIVESEAPSSTTPKEDLKVIPLESVKADELKRIETGIGEFNLVCGGGIVPGSVILVGGEPGIGKSTLAMQVAAFFNTLYISGEESPIQLRNRADRIGINVKTIKISTNTAVEDIISLTAAEKPDCLVIDSIQTLFSTEIPGIVGSVSQIRESASKLVKMAKSKNIPVILIGHITKEGSIAGPKVLEHLVDTVLYFEGDFLKDFRMLRAFKNRFGSVNEIGLFRMAAKGLEEVKDKNKIFLNPFTSNSPGSAISAALEGSRTILFEVQSLVTYTSFPNPRRMADGLDLNRLILINAVLEKHAGLKLNSFDVFINVSGGFRIDETAADLAVAMAITSSLKDKSIPPRMGFLGEISLSGEMRPVSQCSRRIQEFKHSGFKTIILSKSNEKEAKASGFEGEIIGVKHISEAVEQVF
ncbi:MAG: DNA repair protein RadA [bacterium]|nr:DNA repair protein RadA [bacterium]